jgi:murein DD-endopeptidase MepM/ murein hydrolase activator NlpD
MRVFSLPTVRTLATIVVPLAAILVHAVAAPPESVDWPRWRWPLTGQHSVVAPYRAPAHEYGPGHRGADLAARHEAEVLAPADGVVAFSGTVVDRPLLTIAHADGLVTTFEPVRSALRPGDSVSAGQEIGLVSAGGHTSVDALHIGVRHDGDYINPMLLFGEVPRAILLPCCAG